MKKILNLFITFFKIGIMTFGGGIAMLPILEREICDNHKWATKEEMLDYYAISQCTPGIIAVNIATFIGHKVKGFLGGIAATIGVVTPSYIIIVIIASFLKTFASLPYIDSAFKGIRVAVCALVVATVIKLIKNSVKDIFGIVFSVLVFLTVIFLDLSPVIVVITAVALGIIINLIRGRK